MIPLCKQVVNSDLSYFAFYTQEKLKKISRRLRDTFLEASPRLELGVRILQTLALPLGYDAIAYR